MLVLITGGSGSGKSEYAENLTMSLGEQRLYIATMMVYGEEGRRRVARHRKMREHKKFRTVECPSGLETIPDCAITKDAVVLLECMSNLVANEMFPAEGAGRSDREVVDKITGGMERLIRCCRHLVVVTNEVFSDGNSYGPEMEQYIRALGQINVWLASMADQVTEVVCGIPVTYGKEQR